MKRIAIYILAALISMSILAGCSTKDANVKKYDDNTSFTLGELTMEYTDIEITEGSTDSSIILTKDQSTELLDKLKNIGFIQEEYSNKAAATEFRKAVYINPLIRYL